MAPALEWQDKPVKYLRDKVVDQLKFNLVNDHLEMEEFEQLVKIALNTDSKSELMSLVTDLPPMAFPDPKSQKQIPALCSEQERVTNILSATKKSGLWKLPKQLRVLNTLGAIEFDLRNAQFGGDIKYIHVKCYLGDVEIVLPPDVNIISNVKNILGSFEGANQGQMNPDAPTIVITGKVILGNVSISARK